MKRKQTVFYTVDALSSEIPMPVVDTYLTINKIMKIARKYKDKDFYFVKSVSVESRLERGRGYWKEYVIKKGESVKRCLYHG